MKSLKLVMCLLAGLNIATSAFAIVGSIASQDEINMLKKDVLAGKIKIGITRLSKIQDAYGEAPSIQETSRRITYDYGDLKIEFDKNQYLRDWEYDYSHKAAYSDDVDDLRFDLEDQQIVGDYYSFATIRKDYGEPTEINEKTGDGAISTYFYGEIKLTVENVYVVRTWKGRGLDAISVNDTLSSTPLVSESAPSNAAVNTQIGQ